jgi:methylenetetrahydrofolate reductase (NADPH)
MIEIVGGRHMGIGGLLRTRRRGVSFEFFPPRTEEGREELVGTALELRKHHPLFVSVTYGAGGGSRDRTRDTILRLRDLNGLRVMSHLTGVGATRADIDHILADYAANGVRNILALRGDPPKDLEGFDPYRGEFRDARELVAYVAAHGAFSIGVAVYPEGHPEARSPGEELEYTKSKVQAGADFAITQMFFDNTAFYRFMDRTRRSGIDVPILPGIMPLVDFARVKRFAEVCGSAIPRFIEERMGKVWRNPGDAWRTGIELTAAQCEDLLRNGVRFLHFYTLNQSKAVGQILNALGARISMDETANATG